MSEYASKLGLTLLIVAILFVLLIVIGTYLGTTCFLISFAILIAFAIWYYNYNDKKTRCPKQK